MSSVDRTKLNLLLPNLVIDAVAEPTLRANVFSEIYDFLGLRAAETDVLLKSNTTPYTPGASYNPSTKKYVDDAVAAFILNVLTRDNTTAYTPTANYHPATKSYVDQTTAGVILGQVPDQSITTAKLAQDVQAKLSQIYTSERAVANLLARSSIANRTDVTNGFIYDLNDGLNTGSAGKIDFTTTNVVGAITVGTSTVTVKSLTGIVVGQELTIFDDVNLERPIVQAVDGTAKTVTFTAALTKAYKDSAQLCRSSVVQDTTNKLLKFGGWSHSTIFSSTAVAIVGSAYDTSGNGGKKTVMTSNGWLITIEVNGTTIQVQKSIDNGATWNPLCFITGAQVGAAIASFGNQLTVLWNSTTTVYSNTFDVTTVTNTDQNASKVSVAVHTTISNNVSIAYGTDGIPTCVFCSKFTDAPNAFNVRVSKATTTAVTAWATPTVVDLDITTGANRTNPCIFYKGNNPMITYQEFNSATNYMVIFYMYNGTGWVNLKAFSNSTTNVAANLVGIVKQNGSNIGRIWALWDNTDATDTAKRNLWASWSDDGITWGTSFKVTSGNTIDRQKPVLSEDSLGNIFVTYMDGSGISFQKCLDGATTFGSIASLNTIGTNPSSIERLGYIITVPPTVYMSGGTIKFDGIWTLSAVTPVLAEDVRYNITPPSNVSSAVAWVDRQTDAGLSLSAALSIHSTTENFTAMAKTTSTVDGTTSEDQFTGTGTSNSKATLRLTMTRTSTSITKAETQLTGAVGA